MNNILFESLKFIYKEHKDNIIRIPSLAIQNMKQQTLRTSLGIGWVLIRDILFISIFIMFRYLIAGSGDVEGMNYILYMLIGLIAWNFINECLNGAVMAIKSNKHILSSMKFPIVILPLIEVLAIFIKRLFTLLILFFVIYKFGSLKDITWWMLFYYFISMFVLMVIWNLIFTSLVAISNDFEQLYRSIVSILFYTMPIIWSFETLEDYPLIIRVFKLDPFIYIINGFRDACATGNLPNLEYTIYFWGVCFVLLCIGSMLQFKLKRHYIDLI